MSDPKDHRKQFRLTEAEQGKLSSLARHWSCSQTDVVCYLIDVAYHFLPVTGREWGSLQQALTAWQSELERATRENALAFSRAEWNYLADTNNGCSPVMTDTATAPGTLIWANAWDAHRLGRAGDRWFDTDPDEAVQSLCERVRSLTPLHQWAMLISLQWFWWSRKVDHQKEEWWLRDLS